MNLSESSLKRIKYGIWLAFALPVFFLLLIIILIATENLGYIPPFEELENPKSNLASEVISSDNQLLGKYYKENRTIVNFEDLSPNVVNALIATEDARFYSHSGIDFKALARVFFGVITGRSQGGGSTITQQLAKNLYRMREVDNDSLSEPGFLGKLWSTGIMKFQEWVTAVLLERKYTKDEILVMYLNTVTFGQNAFGIKSAARIYFNTSPDSLRIEQAAVLVGLLKAPTFYSPKRNPENSFRRRNTVLKQIERYQGRLNELTGYKELTDEQYDSLRKIPLTIDYQRQEHDEGISTYFREYLRGIMTADKPDIKKYPAWSRNKYYEDSVEWVNNPLYGWCSKNKKPDGSSYNLYNDGLKIYTTINSQMQDYAEKSVSEHMGLGYNINGKKYPSLQETFEKVEINKRKNAPFSWRITDEQYMQIMWNAVRRSERYRVAHSDKGLDSAAIMKEFKTKTDMAVFSWKGEIDTVMTPWDSILYYKKFLRAGFMSMEPQTGFVRAYVGGINFVHFKFDHVMIARRQVGSTFKPFVYTLAMMPGGYSPCYEIPNIPVVFEMPAGQHPPTYSPQFSTSKLDGQMVSLKTGLALSLNQVSAWVMKQYSPEAVIEIARKLGITSQLDPVYSLCVGSAEVKLGEMVAAYAAYANKGVWVEPLFVTRIEDKNGNIISVFKPKKKHAIDENTAYRMVEMMRGVVDIGTSTRIRNTFALTNQIAGKTGTTNNNSDGWFIGFTPDLVSGGWVGGEERSIQFSSTNYGQGANMALPFWALYMRRIYANGKLGYSKSIKFDIPDNPDNVVTDCNEYKNGQINNIFIDDDDDIF